MWFRKRCADTLLYTIKIIGNFDFPIFIKCEFYSKSSTTLTRAELKSHSGISIQDSFLPGSITETTFVTTMDYFLNLHHKD